MLSFSDAIGAPHTATLDRQVRTFVYDRLMTAGKMLLSTEVAGEIGLSLDDVRASFWRMKDGHILVLQEGDEEIWMANPFSAVPTLFLVEGGSRSWWGNCIWDALGIVAMVGGDARISTGCGDCSDAMELLVRAPELGDYPPVSTFETDPTHTHDHHKVGPYAVDIEWGVGPGGAPVVTIEPIAAGK